jgi:hypothetical protein
MSNVLTSIAFSTYFPNGPQGWLPGSQMNALHIFAYEDLPDYMESSLDENTPYTNDLNGKGPLTIAFEKKSFASIEFLLGSVRETNPKYMKLSELDALAIIQYGSIIDSALIPEAINKVFTKSLFFPFNDGPRIGIINDNVSEGLSFFETEGTDLLVEDFATAQTLVAGGHDQEEA